MSNPWKTTSIEGGVPTYDNVHHWICWYPSILHWQFLTTPQPMHDLSYLSVIIISLIYIIVTALKGWDICYLLSAPSYSTWCPAHFSISLVSWCENLPVGLCEILALLALLQNLQASYISHKHRAIENAIQGHMGDKFAMHINRTWKMHENMKTAFPKYSLWIAKQCTS